MREESSQYVLHVIGEAIARSSRYSGTGGDAKTIWFQKKKNVCIRVLFEPIKCLSLSLQCQSLPASFLSAPSFFFFSFSLHVPSISSSSSLPASQPLTLDGTHPSTLPFSTIQLLSSTRNSSRLQRHTRSTATTPTATSNQHQKGRPSRTNENPPPTQAHVKTTYAHVVGPWEKRTFKSIPDVVTVVKTRGTLLKAQVIIIPLFVHASLPSFVHAPSQISTPTLSPPADYVHSQLCNLYIFRARVCNRLLSFTIFLR